MKNDPKPSNPTPAGKGEKTSRPEGTPPPKPELTEEQMAGIVGGGAGGAGSAGADQPPPFEPTTGP
jgi:hypothetical protein